MRNRRLAQGVMISLIIVLMLQTVFPPVVKAAESTRTPDAAIDLMVAARGMLIEEDIDDGTDIAGGGQVFSIRRDVPPRSAAEQILVRLINATKKQLGDLERACNELRGSYGQPGQECEDKLTKAFCDTNIAKLRARLSFLRKVRGDRRKGLTKAWHSIKRAGARIWRNVGPIGRRFLRNLGDEAFAIVKSGGSLHGGVLRKLVIKHARTIARREGRRMLKRTARRVILGRAEKGEDCGSQAGAGTDEVQITLEYTTTDWFEAVWRDIEVLLKSGRQYCQKSKVNELRSCLYQKNLAAVTVEEALEACDPLLKAIPKNDAGGSVSLEGMTYYVDGNPNQVSITYPSDGGSVTGSVHVVRHSEVFGCTYTLKATLEGQYDPDTCMMQGSAEVETLHEGDVCVSVCGSAPSSPTACPVTFNRTWGWEAELEDGVVRGQIVGENVDRGYFDFRAPAADG